MDGSTKTGLSGIPGTPAPPPFSNTSFDMRAINKESLNSNKLPARIDATFRPSDLNLLPRHTIASEQLVSAIDNVNKKISRLSSMSDTQPDNGNVTKHSFIVFCDPLVLIFQQYFAETAVGSLRGLWQSGCER